MDMLLRKGFPNQAVGKCGKKTNKIIVSTLFKNEDDAKIFRNKHHATKFEPFEGCFTVNGTSLKLKRQKMVLSMARLDVMRAYTELEKMVTSE